MIKNLIIFTLIFIFIFIILTINFFIRLFYNKNAIIFFTYKPSKEIFDFAEKLHNNNYDIYISVNDNDYILPEYNSNLITVIKLDDSIVKNAGYYNSNYNIRGDVSSRDKAFYYFNKISMITYNKYWFIEEDVFIPTTKTIINIDNKYKNGDYLSKYDFIIDDNIDKYKNTNHLVYKYDSQINNMAHHDNAFIEIIQFNINLKMPWLKGTTCAIRTSKKFLDSIDKFASEYKILLLDEVLYSTLAKDNNLKIIYPEELLYITAPRDNNNYNIIDLQNLNPNYLYHPIKDLKLQNELRIKYNFI